MSERRDRASIQPVPQPQANQNRYRLAVVLALAVLAGGCGSDNVRSPTAPDPVEPVVRALVGIEIVNAPPTGLTVGYTVRLEVHGTYSDGTKRIEAAAWTSSVPGVASVDAGGAVRGQAAGVSTITATVGDHRATVTIEVRTPGPTRSSGGSWRSTTMSAATPGPARTPASRIAIWRSGCCGGCPLRHRTSSWWRPAWMRLLSIGSGRRFLRRCDS